MKRHLLDERQKKLTKRQAQLAKYGQRLDRISEEHASYYNNVILTAYEQTKKKEEELARREEEVAKKEKDLPEKIASYQKYIDENVAYIQQQQDYIAFLGEEIKTLEAKKKSLQGAVQIKKQPPPSKLLKPPGFNRKSG